MDYLYEAWWRIDAAADRYEALSLLPPGPERETGAAYHAAKRDRLHAAAKRIAMREAAEIVKQLMDNRERLENP